MSIIYETTKTTILVQNVTTQFNLVKTKDFCPDC